MRAILWLHHDTESTTAQYGRPNARASPFQDVVQLLINEIPLVFRESLRLGRVHLSTPSDFEVRLCHVADLCPGRDGIPGDEMIAVMIQVAGANYPLTFYELWKTQSRH